MKALKPHRLMLIFALVATGAAASTQPSSDTSTACAPASAYVQRGNDGSWNESQQRLGQGVALFDEGKLNLAAEQLKRAVAGNGLTNALERATAHKYLALYYCATQSSALCARHFELAIEASSEVTFDNSELKTPAYTRALQTAQRKVARERTVAAADSPRVATTPPLPSAPTMAPATTSRSNAIASVNTSGKGSILLDVRPWAEVRVNNDKPIITPPSKVLTLTPGRHIVTVRNPAGPSLRTELNVPAGGSVELSHRF